MFENILFFFFYLRVADKSFVFVYSSVPLTIKYTNTFHYENCPMMVGQFLKCDFGAFFRKVQDKVHFGLRSSKIFPEKFPCAQKKLIIYYI